MTRDELYKQISTPTNRHPVLEQFEVRASAAGEALTKVDLFALRGSRYRFDYLETSLVLPNEVVVPELITGIWFDATPVASFEHWRCEFAVNSRTIASFSVHGCSESGPGALRGPHRLDRPVLVRPGDTINALFEGPTVEVGVIALKLYGFEAPYSVLPDVTHLAAESA